MVSQVDFQHLPRELRQMVYGFVLDHDINCHRVGSCRFNRSAASHVSLFLVNKVMSRDAREFVFDRSQFWVGCQCWARTNNGDKYFRRRIRRVNFESPVLSDPAIAFNFLNDKNQSPLYRMKSVRVGMSSLTIVNLIFPIEYTMLCELIDRIESQISDIHFSMGTWQNGVGALRIDAHIDEAKTLSLTVPEGAAVQDQEIAKLVRGLPVKKLKSTVRQGETLLIGPKDTRYDADMVTNWRRSGSK